MGKKYKEGEVPQRAGSQSTDSRMGEILCGFSLVEDTCKCQSPENQTFTRNQFLSSEGIHMRVSISHSRVPF